MIAENVIIRTGIVNMKFNEITSMLSKIYWSLGIKQPEVEKGALNSALVVGAFLEDGKQIGYARVISDKTRFAYITDVIVHENHRKKGIGKMMIKEILDSKELIDVYQWLLITKDAHELYRKYGFSETKRPNDLMEIWDKRPNR